MRRGYELHVLRSSWAFLVGSDSRFVQAPSWIRLRVFCVSKRTVGVAEPIKNVWLEAVCEIRELHIFIETSYSSWNSILKLHSWNCIYCSWNCIAEIAYWKCIAGTAYCFTWYVFVYLVCMELLWYYFLLPETAEYLELYLKPPATAENCWKLTASKIELGISRDKAWTCMELPETVYRKPFTPQNGWNSMELREKYPKNFHTLHFSMKLTHPLTFF